MSAETNFTPGRAWPLVKWKVRQNFITLSVPRNKQWKFQILKINFCQSKQLTRSVPRWLSCWPLPLLPHIYCLSDSATSPHWSSLFNTNVHSCSCWVAPLFPLHGLAPRPTRPSCTFLINNTFSSKGTLCLLIDFFITPFSRISMGLPPSAPFNYTPTTRPIPLIYHTCTYFFFNTCNTRIFFLILIIKKFKKKKTKVVFDVKFDIIKLLWKHPRISMGFVNFHCVCVSDKNYM